MAKKGKLGFLVAPVEWAKHLRPWGKRLQWGKERAAESQKIHKEVFDSRELP